MSDMRGFGVTRDEELAASADAGRLAALKERDALKAEVELLKSPIGEGGHYWNKEANKARAERDASLNLLRDLRAVLNERLWPDVYQRLQIVSDVDAILAGNPTAQDKRLARLLAESNRLLKDAKRILWPDTTNSEADVAIARNDEALRELGLQP